MINYGFGCELGPLDRVYMNRIRHWRNDERVWKWCRQFTVLNEHEHERWFDAQAMDRSIKMYAVHRANPASSGDTMCGVTGLTSIDPVNRRAEFSLYIAPDTQKKGLGRSALATLLTHGFQDLGLNLIWGETFEGNHAARMFSEMGFVKEGTRRQFYFRNGGFVGAHLFSITGEEWRQHSSQVRARSQGRR